MGPKATPVKPQNTLFSYFSKSPTVPKNDSNANVSQEVLSPKRSPNQKSKSTTDSSSKSSGVIDFSVGDLVWAKLTGYPWWPSLVCNHPTDDSHYKTGKTPQLHVQFFDNPVSRSWIPTKNVKPFIGKDDPDCKRGGTYFSTSPPVQKGIIDADKALKLTLDERLKLVVELQPSDEEEEEEEEMDLDPDIFDAEMTDEGDNSKENIGSETKKSPKKTPSKSPRKHKGRPQRSRAKRRKIIVDDGASEDDSADEFKPGSSGDEDDEGSSGVDEDDVTSDSALEPDSPVKLPKKRKRSQAPALKEEEPKGPRGPRTLLQKKQSSQKNTPSSKPLSDQEDEEKVSSPPVNKSSLAVISSGSATPVVSSGSATPVVSSGSATPVVSKATKSKLALFSASESSFSVTGDSEEKMSYQHMKYDWLQPDTIRDEKKQFRSDEDYDPRTLYIPESEKFKFTPAMRQWWEIKTHHFDTILFFKMGKFYELFHMDAAVAVNELGLIYMKGDYAHSGFPEIAYTRYADTLVQKGYKVARIEQTETPDMMAERCKTMAKAPSKFDKVVKREVCRITTKGTKTFSFLSGECTDSQSTYLLALSEKNGSSDGCSVYGVCFVDTSIGKFHVGQFEDDRHSSRLRTMLSRYPPVQVLLEKGKTSQRTMSVISNNLTSVIKENLAPRTEFWDSSKTLKVLAEENYFKEEGEGEHVWPETIKSMISDADTLGCTAAEDYTLAVSALGAVTWYLQYSLLDEEILSMKNFELYTPLDGHKSDSEKKTTFNENKKHMVLDGVTLANLDITENSSTGTLDGTLLQRLDHCFTPFGKRLFRQWLCAPLCNPTSINDRLDAVEDLIGCQDVVAEVTEMLKKMPDLERLLSRMHTLGTKNSNHPDHRAILYEDVTYSKRKIEDFLSTLTGFKTASQISKKFAKVSKDFKSTLLRRTMSQVDEGTDGCFPKLQEDLDFFQNAFDHQKAKKDGVILPSSGVDPDYDTANKDIKSTEKTLNEYLDKQRTRLGCKSIVYWGTAKNRFQMEVPENAWKRVPDEYETTSSKKGWKRYRTAEIEKLMSRLMDAEDRKDVALRDVMRRIFHNFDNRYKIWDTTVQCLSVLDVLISLAQYSRCGEGAMCRPEIILPNQENKPFLEVREARHPCISKTFSGSDFIPNDTVIGIADENDMETDEERSGDSTVVLVTGPNMGGKSTLMRQVGLITVIAQMGCYVPAEKCRLTPVDRVFTRLGASDNIMSGESTFFVELSETSAILQHATQHSLVLVDELGRGTATYDGTAIACSVVQELSRKLCCRTLFSTHYHSLVEEFSHDPNIRLGHMACMVENEDEEDPTQETITFLYKFTQGACPKSYGFNAARLADLPEEVIKVAVHKSKEFEESLDRVRLMKSLWKDDAVERLGQIQSQICVS